MYRNIFEIVIVLLLNCWSIDLVWSNKSNLTLSAQPKQINIKIFIAVKPKSLNIGIY